MNRDPIVFRVDATTQSGWESYARCMVFAAALQRRRRPTYFLSQLEPSALAFNIKRAGHDWLDADAPVGTAEDLTETLQEVRRLKPAAVIVDAPNATEDYLAEIRSAGPLVVSMDHLATLRFPSQVIINPLLGPGSDAYSYQPGAQLLLGARFALIRPEVRRARPIRSQEPPQPFRMMLALGEDDPHRKTLDLARQLLGQSRIGQIDVVVRTQHPDREALEALAATHPGRLELAGEGADLTGRLSRCHFALTGGSGISIELACVGIPQLVLVQSEGYWPTAQRLEEEGAATCLGWHESVSAGTIRQAIQNLLGDPLERQSMARCGRQLIDGRGPDRLVTGVEVMLHRPRYAGLQEAA
jgi:spore coat polysaccharide biosynthesis predicted glycosyltransferase SpsG